MLNSKDENLQYEKTNDQIEKNVVGIRLHLREIVPDTLKVLVINHYQVKNQTINLFIYRTQNYERKSLGS